MLVQILLCGCKVEKFHQEQNEHVKKWCNFQCHCDDIHLFVYSSKAHLFVASRIQEMDFHCTCAKIRSNSICNFCVQARYFLNFRAYKICGKKIPLGFQEHLVPISEYLEEIIICNALFTILPQAKKLIFLCTTLVKNMC